MTFQDYLVHLKKLYPSYHVLKSHVKRVLSERDQREADKSRLPQKHPVAGVLCTMVIPRDVIQNNLNPVDHIYVIYEKRSEKMKNHPGQMAFPGGTMEDQDKGSIISTAYREANEEIGIDPDDLEFIAFMDEFIASSNILVHPVVSWLVEDIPLSNFREQITDKYRPKTTESIATVVMPLIHLLNPEYYESRPYEREGRHVGFIRYFYTTEVRPNDNIWGLTASMTRRLIDILFPDHPLPEELIKER